jgi:hypothetical protein
MKIRQLCTLILAGALLGCFQDTTGMDGGGSFTATVTGDITANFQGVALFATEPGFAFALVLTSPDNTHAVAFARNQSSRPAVGQHGIVATEEAAEAAFLANYARQNEPQAHFVSTGGTMQITSSGTRRLVGTFTFDAVGVRPSDPETELRITVSGTFDALCAGLQGSICN